MKADGFYSVAICVGDTAIYAYCDAENDTKINSILDSVGYINTVPEQTLPVWLMPVSRLLQFVFYIPMALIGRHWLWCAAYKLAGKTSKQINDSGKTRKELLNWITEISPIRKTTETILVLYKLNLVPEFIGVIFAIVGCFTIQMNNLLNTIGVVIPGIIFASGIVGAILSKIFASKKR